MSVSHTADRGSGTTRTYDRTLELGASPCQVLAFLHTHQDFLHARFDTVLRSTADSDSNAPGTYTLVDVAIIWPSKWKVVIQNTPHGATLDASNNWFRTSLHEEWTVDDVTAANAVIAKVKIVSSIQAVSLLQKTVRRFLKKREKTLRKKWPSSVQNPQQAAQKQGAQQQQQHEEKHEQPKEPQRQADEQQPETAQGSAAAVAV